MKKETKMAAAPGGGQDALMRAFEAFKEANDARLAAIESGHADVLLEEKVDRIDRALTEQKTAIDRLALAARRPALAAEAPALSEHKAAWTLYLRKGDDAGLSRIEAKALSVGSDPDGGYVAPPELDRLIDARLRNVSPMRQIATVRTTGSTVFKKPISITAAGTGWVLTSASLITLFAPQPVRAPMDFIRHVMLAGHGVLFEAWLALGGVLAAPVFASSVITLPLLLDRRIGVLDAVLTSWRAVLANPVPLGIWAALVMGFTLLGLGSLLLGLLLVVPLLGHASWHAYRDTVDASALPERAP